MYDFSHKNAKYETVEWFHTLIKSYALTAGVSYQSRPVDLFEPAGQRNWLFETI